MWLLVILVILPLFTEHLLLPLMGDTSLLVVFIVAVRGSHVVVSYELTVTNLSYQLNAREIHFPATLTYYYRFFVSKKHCFPASPCNPSKCSENRYILSSGVRIGSNNDRLPFLYCSYSGLPLRTTRVVHAHFGVDIVRI